MAATQTTQGYHRVLSPSLLEPRDAFESIPVGLLACQRDPFLKEVTTTVVSWMPATEAPVPSKGKAKTAPAKAEPLFEVVLHDTVLFPEGGGQPSDIGIIHAEGHGSWSVTEVKRRGGSAIHYLKALSSDSTPPPTASTVVVQLGDEGTKRRYDHMCIHTSQHLISALLFNKFSISTVSWSLTAFPTPSYVELSRPPTAEEIVAIQEELQRIVSRPQKVFVEVDVLEASGAAEPNGLDRKSAKALPADYTGGVKRTVVIEGIDRNSCCGTHLPDLHGLSIFLLPQIETLSRSTVRLFFLAGPRVAAHLAATHALLTASAVALGCGATQVPVRAAQELEARQKAEKRTKELEEEVARQVAIDLEKELGKQIDEQGGNLATASQHRTDEASSNPLALLQLVQAALSIKHKDNRPYLILLTSSQTGSSGGSVVLVFGSDEATVKSAGEFLRNKGVKGGGKGPKWSGKVVGKWAAVEIGDECLDTCRKQYGSV